MFKESVLDSFRRREPSKFTLIEGIVRDFSQNPDLEELEIPQEFNAFERYALHNLADRYEVESESKAAEVPENGPSATPQNKFFFENAPPAKPKNKKVTLRKKSSNTAAAT